VAQIPFLAGDAALKEIRWAKEHGAVGIHKRGVECGGLPANDRLFWPAYSLAGELDLPICIHVGSEWRPRATNLTLEPFANGFEGLQAFRSLVDGKISDRFPDLRVGFIEFGSAWLPHIFPFIRTEKTLADLNFFVTCEAGEDIGYITKTSGDDYLLLGSDYTHADRASVRDAHGQLLDRTDISSETKLKITETNAKRFYPI
jgi:predicted TIM-barrel fold metal-dependent hydrolase